MRMTSRNLIRLLLLATLALCLPCLTGCPRLPAMVVIPADKVIKPLPNGNYEVTPAWLQERYRYERWAAEQLKACPGEKAQ